MKRFSLLPSLVYFSGILMFTSLLGIALDKSSLPVLFVAAFETGVGILLVLFFLRRIDQIGNSLERFLHGDSGKPVRRVWFDPLAGLVALVNQVIAPQGSRQKRDQLELSIELAAAQQERNRLARELHDSIKQQLFSIQMSAAAAEQRLSSSDPGFEAAQAAVQDARKSAHEALVEMNALLDQLSPAPLEKAGLAQALRDQCEALGYRSGAEVTCEIGELPPEGWLVSGVQDALFRIAQEALSNVSRHARAAHVGLALVWDPAARRIELAISDDGAGFDPAETNGGRGLAGMRARVEEMGGVLTLDSAPGKGTHLTARFPVYQEAIEPDIPVDTTPNKVGAVGLAGGILAAAALAAVWIIHTTPDSAGWSGSLYGIPAVLIYVLAAVILVAGGWLAARLAGRNGVLAGAAAGLLAGMSLYGLLGGAWAGVHGSADLLRVGLNPLGESTLANQLLVNGAGSILLWTGALYPAVLLAGAGLGALGGLLARRNRGVDLPPDWRAVVSALLTPLLVSSAAGLLIASFAMPLIEISTQDQSLFQQGASVPALLQLAIMAAFYVIALVWQFTLLRSQSGLRQAAAMLNLHWQALIWSLLSGGLGVAQILLGLMFLKESLDSGLRGLPASTLFLVFFLGVFGLFMGLAFGIQLIVNRRIMRENGQELPSAMVYVGLALLPFGLVFSFLGLRSSRGWLSLALLVWLVEGIGVLYLLFLRHRPAGRQGSAGRLAARQNTARLNGSWLPAALLFLLPVLGMGAGGISLLTIPLRMSAFFDSQRLGLETLPYLTLGGMLSYHYQVWAAVFAGLLLVALALTGFRLVVGALGSLRTRKEL